MLVAILSLSLSACAQLSPARLERAQALAVAVRPSALACERSDRCALDSPLLDQARVLTSAAGPPQHRLRLLEDGEDALLARIHLIRAARETIELQSFIFAEDDVGWMMLNELLQAARRGVRVRVLLDQLFSVDDTRLLAALSAEHVNFDLRLYNPTFGKARIRPLEFGAGIVCCFRRVNQRMHGKLLAVDGVVAITGGRNYQDRYYDWDPDYNYRDRDLLVLGPEVAAMIANFDAFWEHPLAVPAARLHDVARVLLHAGGPPDGLPAPRLRNADRIVALSAAANDPAQIVERLLAPAFAVARVEFLADLPAKHEPTGSDGHQAAVSAALRALVAGAERSVVLQTPYLVMSRPARRTFRALRKRPHPPEVLVSTNSLAATDAWPVYALSHKYKRTYLRDLGLDIREFKPFPTTPATTATDAGGSAQGRVRLRGSGAGSGASPYRPLPLTRPGRRHGLHAKSLVIDSRIGVVGTHNFDPRSDRFNTESAIVVYDAAFAAALEARIRADADPDRAWVIARRARPPVLSGVDYAIGKVFEKLPLFDVWPFRYATSYERRPQCPDAQPVGDLARSDCWRAVGAFPEVKVPLKGLSTRLVTAFGAGLAPIL